MDKIKKLEALIANLETVLKEAQELLKEIEEEDRKQRTVTEAPAAIIVDGTMWKLDPRTGYYVSASGKIGVYEHNKMTLMKRYISSDGYMTIRPTKKKHIEFHRWLRELGSILCIKKGDSLLNLMTTTLSIALSIISTSSREMKTMMIVKI